MDTLSAFARGEASRDNELKVFDWAKAAHLIRDRRPDNAAAGLSGDWEWTGGAIWEDGKPVPKDETYTFLASTWAIPELDLDGDVVECWRWQHDVPDWDARTYWPEGVTV